MKLHMAFAAGVFVSSVVGLDHAPTAVAQGPQTAGTAQGVTDRIAAIENQLARLQRLNRLALDLTPNRSVTLDCATHNYAEIVGTNGLMPFLVSCESIEPYLEGYRLTLEFGNPWSFAFRGLTGVIGYGEGDYTNPNRKAAPLSTPETLKPGKWTAVQIVLNPAAAREVRNLSLDQIALTTAAAR